MSPSSVVSPLNLRLIWLASAGGSWCYTQYTDSTPGFAISRQQMINDFNGDEMAARKAYCGLEAVVTTPEGRSETLYIGTS